MPSDILICQVLANGDENRKQKLPVQEESVTSLDDNRKDCQLVLSGMEATYC